MRRRKPKAWVTELVRSSLLTEWKLAHLGDHEIVGPRDVRCVNQALCEHRHHGVGSRDFVALRGDQMNRNAIGRIKSLKLLRHTDA